MTDEGRKKEEQMMEVNCIKTFLNGIFAVVNGMKNAVMNGMKLSMIELRL
jgi:hypothetical protein